jgi:nucleotide-binding universal stress UspA family protein
VDRVVVGVDGSDGAAAALRWAARESDLRRLPLTAVLAWNALDRQLRADPAGDPHCREPDARRALDGILAATLGVSALDEVERRVVCDTAAPALLATVHPGDLLVVGARGLGRVREVMLGSVSQQCLARARCSVAVIHAPARGSGTRPERIVVGVDGSPASAQALAWAVDEGRLRGARLLALHAFTPAYGGDPAVVWSSGHEAEDAQGLLDAAVDRVEGSALAGPVERQLVCDRPGPALLRAAEGADLMVLGSHGEGRWRRLLLGSVSRDVTTRATCPVVVVRPPRGGD